MKLKVNPSLRVRWKHGRPLMSMPGQPAQVLHGEGAVSILCDFSRPRAVDEVIGEYEDAAIAAEAISTLFRHGALVVDGATAPMPPDLLYFEEGFAEIQAAVQSLTMGTPQINYALYKATQYISQSAIPGAIVESGVWKGGSAMICALALIALDDLERDFYLYDSFDGSWPDPGPQDGTIYEDEGTGQRPTPPAEELKRELDIESVRARLESTGYPPDRIHMVRGRVQETVPAVMPEKIAVLRLDTDYFASTYHELRNFYPRLATGGILLVDDYPTERGATQAVQQYFSETNQRIFLNRIDVQGRIGVKQRLLS